MINKSMWESWKEMLMSHEHVEESKVYATVSN